MKISNGVNVAKLIDHTNINIKATAKDIKKTCQEAIEYGFRGVDVRPQWIKLVKKELAGTDIHPVKSRKAGAPLNNFVKDKIAAKRHLTGQFNRIKVIVLIDPPMGLSSHQERIKMCKKAKADGADELDVVMNIVDLKYERYQKILKDLKPICKILPTKVIIGSGYLTDEEVEKASRLVKKAGAISVKTATEKDPLERRELEEKARHLKIMKKAAPGLLIKASAQIRTLDDVKKMVKAGADIIGTSSGVNIKREVHNKHGKKI